MGEEGKYVIYKDEFIEFVEDYDQDDELIEK